jgi:Protein of unknown function (DUF3696)
MRISRIHLENFQSIASPVTLEVAPITLLYGPNSAGKSAVGDAIQLLAGLLLEGADEDATLRWMTSGRNKMRIGVGVDLEKPVDLMSLLVEVGMRGEHERSGGLEDRDSQTHDYAQEILQPNAAKEAASDSKDITRRIDVLIDIAREGQSWHNDRRPIIEAYRLRVDGEPFVEVIESGRSIRIYQNTLSRERHGLLPLMAEEIREDAMGLQKALGRQVSKYFIRETKKYLELSYLYVPLNKLSLRDSLSAPDRGVHYYDEKKAHKRQMDVIIGLDDDDWRETDLWSYFESKFSISTKVDYLDMRAKLVGLTVLIARCLGLACKSMVRVGPTRTVPSPEQLEWARNKLYARQNEYPRYLKESDIMPFQISDRKLQPDGDWTKGLAAWKDLASNSFDRDRVNRWLGEGFLNLGYSVVTNTYKLSIDNRYEQPTATVGGEAREAEFSAPVGYLGADDTRYVLFLRDIGANQSRGLDDVGSGVVQVLPVLAALARRNWVSFIEQPELHLHLRSQLALADVFIEAACSKFNNMWNMDDEVFLIETHSENFALRMLRRVSEGAIPDAKMLVFYYFQKKKRHTVPVKITVDSRGRFVEPWPEGFFEERELELFS